LKRLVTPYPNISRFGTIERNSEGLGYGSFVKSGGILYDRSTGRKIGGDLHGENGGNLCVGVLIFENYNRLKLHEDIC